MHGLFRAAEAYGHVFYYLDDDAVRTLDLGGGFGVLRAQVEKAALVHRRDAYDGYPFGLSTFGFVVINAAVSLVEFFPDILVQEVTVCERRPVIENRRIIGHLELAVHYASELAPLPVHVTEALGIFDDLGNGGHRYGRINTDVPQFRGPAGQRDIADDRLAVEEAIVYRIA